jgi:hypothetical protein
MSPASSPTVDSSAPPELRNALGLIAAFVFGLVGIVAVVVWVVFASGSHPLPVAAVDTSTFTMSLDQLSGVNGSVIEVEHRGEANVDVVVWLFVDHFSSSADGNAMARAVARVIDSDPGVSDQAVSVAFVAGRPAAYPTHSDVVAAALPGMARISKALGIAHNSDTFLRLTPIAVAHIMHTRYDVPARTTRGHRA